MITEGELRLIRSLYDSPKSATDSEWEDNNTEDRRCQDCNQLFTPQEPHHRKCRDCWMEGYRAWEIRTFPNLYRHQARVIRGNFADDD